MGSAPLRPPLIHRWVQRDSWDCQAWMGGSALAMSQRASAAQQQVSVAASLQKHILFFLGVYSASPLTTHG